MAKGWSGLWNPVMASMCIVCPFQLRTHIHIHLFGSFYPAGVGHLKAGFGLCGIAGKKTIGTPRDTTEVSGTSTGPRLVV